MILRQLLRKLQALMEEDESHGAREVVSIDLDRDQFQIDKWDLGSVDGKPAIFLYSADPNE